MLIEGPIVAARTTHGRTKPRSAFERGSATRAKAVTHCHEAEPAMIGPHAVIHLVEAMRDHLGDKAARTILASARIAVLPTGTTMIREVEALRLHRWLAMREPVDCFAITTDAARRTADYIIANRIPPMAVRLLQILPARLSAYLLMSAIGHHAWTFVGAGRFQSRGAWAFEIDRSEADDPVLLPESLFNWYAKVFEHMYRRLVSPDCRCALERPASSLSQVHHYRIMRG